jgi:hypothetical protein
VTADLLEPQVRALFADLTRAGEPRHPGSEDRPPGERTVEGEAGREQRGIRVRFTLRFQGPRLVQARYRAYGCPHTLAACEWLARRLEAGEAASLGKAADWCLALGIPIVKLGRLLVVEDALTAAFEKLGAATTTTVENVVK